MARDIASVCAPKSAPERNGAIDFYRFLFACIIYILHIRRYGNFDSPNGQFNGGYLGVEFFFILSGFLMMRNIQSGIEAAGGDSSAEQLTVKYFISRYKKLMPPYWFYGLTFLVVRKLTDPEYGMKKAFLKGLPDFLGIEVFWQPGQVGGALWYVSALLWASSLIYYLLLKKRNFALYILFPVGILTALGYMYEKIGYIDVSGNQEMFLSPLLRALAEISLGCIIYCVYQKLSIKRYSTMMMSFLEVGLLAVVVIVMYRTRRDYKDFIMVFIIGAFILVTMLKQGILTKLLDNKVSVALGAVSYHLYLSQGIFHHILLQKFPGLPFWPVVLTSLSAAVIFASVTTAAFKRFKPRVAVYDLNN